MASGSKGTRKLKVVSSSTSKTIDKARRYCVQAVNYMTESMELELPKIKSIDEISMILLIQIHCTLLGLDFQEFLPSASETEDAERIILSLKDEYGYGTGKFEGLEADKIAAKDPIQLQFLLENYHLILNHEMAKVEEGNRSDEERSTTSTQPTSSSRDVTSSSEDPSRNSAGPSRNSAGPSRNSAGPSRISAGPSRNSAGPSRNVTSSSEGPSRNSARSSRNVTASSYETVEDVKVKIYDSDKSKNISAEPHRSTRSRSKNVADENISEIDEIEFLAKNKNFGKQKSAATRQHQNKNETQSYTNNDSSSDKQSAALKKLGDIHKSLRTHVSDSFHSLNSEVTSLTQKSSKGKCVPKHLPDLMWLMPVDVRFPKYSRGVIISKCEDRSARIKRYLRQLHQKQNRARAQQKQFCEDEEFQDEEEEQDVEEGYEEEELEFPNASNTQMKGSRNASNTEVKGSKVSSRHSNHENAPMLSNYGDELMSNE